MSLEEAIDIGCSRPQLLTRVVVMRMGLSQRREDASPGIAGWMPGALFHVPKPGPAGRNSLATACHQGAPHKYDW